MDKFESQFADLDVQTSYMESTMSDTTALTTPQDQVDSLINQVADEAGLEIQHGLGEAKVPTEAIAAPAQAEAAAPKEEDSRLAERLRALRVSLMGKCADSSLLSNAYFHYTRNDVEQCHAMYAYKCDCSSRSHLDHAPAARICVVVDLADVVDIGSAPDKYIVLAVLNPSAGLDPLELAEAAGKERDDRRGRGRSGGGREW